MTRLQRGIIKAVSTIMFQNNGEYYKDDPMSYWIRDSNRGVNIVPDSDDSIEYNLSTKKIDDKYYLEIWSQCYDEYGVSESMTIEGYIPFELDRACWDMDLWCHMIENIINP